MTKNEKVEIFNKYQQNKDKDIINNKGLELPFGSSKVIVKALPWTKSNDFEDEIKRIVLKFKDYIKLDASENIEVVVNGLMSLLREDLIILANKATNGYITLDKIEKYQATKNDVIKVVLESVSINYSYAKNLITQLRKIR